MNQQPITYGKLLLYHFIIGLIGFTIGGIVIAAPVIGLITELVAYSELSTYNYQNDFLLKLFATIVYFFGLLLLAFFISKFFTAGLSYIPYLYKTNNLSLKSILLIGFKKGFGVILFYILITIFLGIIGFIFGLIPIIGYIVTLGIGYIVGLLFLWLDYHLSRNALHGQGMFAHIGFNITQLFKHSRPERQVYITPLYYMLVSFVGLANLFIKPLFHLRIIQILQDEEQAYFNPPAPLQPPPSHPPQNIGY